MSAHGTHTFEARAGHHLPPLPLSTGRNVFEELGSGFALLALGAGAAAVQTFEESAAALSVPLVVVRDSFAGGREAYGRRLVLVRPDQYVAWAGNRGPDDVDGVLRQVTGRG